MLFKPINFSVAQSYIFYIGGFKKSYGRKMATRPYGIFSK